MENEQSLTQEQTDWLESTSAEALDGQHLFPAMAACEAALESGFGTSGLAKNDNNLFGMKQHQHPVYGTASLPTREFLKGEWVEVEANWVKYPDLASCFADRMATLKRMAPYEPHYAAALEALDPVAFVTEVSQTWSTDPNRASKVISIYNSWKSAQEQ